MSPAAATQWLAAHVPRRRADRGAPIEFVDGCAETASPRGRKVGRCPLGAVGDQRLTDMGLTSSACSPQLLASKLNTVTSLLLDASLRRGRPSMRKCRLAATIS